MHPQLLSEVLILGHEKTYKRTEIDFEPSTKSEKQIDQIYFT